MTLSRDWVVPLSGSARVFICLFSQLKVSAIADGEGLPQYKLYYFQMAQLNLEIVLIPEKRKSTDTKRAASTQQKQLFFISPSRNARTAAQPLPPHSCASRSADTQ